MDKSTLYTVGIVAGALGSVVAASLTRRWLASRDRAHQLELLVDSAIEEGDDERLEMHTDEVYQEAKEIAEDLGLEFAPVREASLKTLTRKLVSMARAEFGAPFGPSYEKPGIREATAIKVRDFLSRECKERNVRSADREDVLDDAVALYFVPTRRDIKRAELINSPAVDERQSLFWLAKGRHTTGTLRWLLHQIGYRFGVQPITAGGQ